ncbi:topology modulation protein [Culicoidibacter larvae]|uniref:Topology modulation protein n=1 Tax=Culicoidibacter larvae TaxID=2579976 RepID=A0A5R8QCD7_9FIRM|nr:topology modulation protein [Culicoidibacter larvae]TLG73936.1 topology modulation protein [Culicoidibacter larvae]
MKKICIIGPSGAGKSTFARRLGAALVIPVFHLDQMFWRENWQSIGKDALLDDSKEVMTTESAWIIDGNYADSLPLRLEYADTVIFLDFPRRIYFPRVIKRYFQYRGRTREDMSAGCEEKLDLEFLTFVWNFKRESRPRVIAALAQSSSEFDLIVLKNPRQVREFLGLLVK